jgi:hypothetical protein
MVLPGDVTEMHLAPPLLKGKAFCYMDTHYLFHCILVRCRRGTTRRNTMMTWTMLMRCGS